MVSSNDDDRKTPLPAKPAEGGDPAGARKDLAAAGVVGAVAVLAIILGLRMPNPEANVFTAPGFMPFLTGLSLLVMAVGLGVSALKKGAWTGAGFSPGELLRGYFGDYENQWALILMGLAVLYVLLIDWVTFDVAIPLGVAGWRFGFSSFEAVTIPALAIVLRIFWPKSFMRCLLVAAISTLVLAAAFRYGFRIPLPGSG